MLLAATIGLFFGGSSSSLHPVPVLFTESCTCWSYIPCMPVEVFLAINKAMTGHNP